MDRDSILIVMFFPFFICQVQSNQIQPAQHGYLVPSFNDVLSNKSAMASFNELSEIKCAAECSKRSECHSFFYSKTTSKCQLHSTVLSWYTSGSVAFPGFRYYRMQKERDFDNGCPSWAIAKEYKYNSTAGVCYFYYSNSLTWQQVREVYANDSGHLLSYTDQATHNWVVDLVRGTHAVFIDGYDENNNDNFKDYKNDPVSGNFWGTNQPDNAGNREDCIVLHRYHQYKWSDNSCGDAHPFVCKIVW